MIDCRELRIGNWVDDHGNYRQITRLNMSQTIVDNPIPLTEDVLLKFCGFVKDGNTDYYTCRKVGFTINLSGSIGYRTCIWSNDQVKHLHQLQNLYYALTGEELEVKWS